MARVPRRLRHLNLDEEDAVNVQLDEENLHNHEVYDDDANAQVDNVEVNENSLQDPLEIGIPLQSKRPIRIIWPNGVVQQVLGDFRVKHLQQLNGGKVIVETDESGVPNDRSGSILGQHLGDLAESPTFAPLHIKRWSDELFWKHHKAIISDVEEKFIYSSATKQLTRDCILKKVSKAWRSYKSRLKKKYFNREKRTLDAILQDVPKGVNPYQWSALIAIWCEDSHVNLCKKNSECAKQQRNPHTTGRKNHAMVLKEMKIRKKGEDVSLLDLWEEAHKKKDGNFANESMKKLMDMAYQELAKRKANNKGILSSKDYKQVFEKIIAKKIKLRGYYENKYRSLGEVSGGLTFDGKSEHVEAQQLAMQEMGNRLENMSAELNLMRAFMEQKFPGEDWRSFMLAAENNEVDTFEQLDDDPTPTDGFENNLDDSYVNADATPNNSEKLQQLFSVNCTNAKESDASPFLLHEHMIAQQALVRKTGKTTVPCTSRKHRINQVDLFEQADNDIVDGCENNHEISYYNLHARPNNMQQSCFVNSTKTKENYANKNLPNERMVSKQAQVESAAKRLKISQSNLESAVPREPNVNHGSQRMVLQQNPSKPDQTEVFLFSLNAITKGKIVAKGNLLRKDRTEVIGGNMLGDEFYGVAVHAVTKYGDEMLPRPYENFRTVRDAIGRLIAWPRSYVKKPKNKTSTRPQVG